MAPSRLEQLDRRFTPAQLRVAKTEHPVRAWKLGIERERLLELGGGFGNQVLRVISQAEIRVHFRDTGSLPGELLERLRGRGPVARRHRSFGIGGIPLERTILRGLRLHAPRDDKRAGNYADQFQSKTLAAVIHEMLQKTSRLSQGNHLPHV